MLQVIKDIMLIVAGSMFIIIDWCVPCMREVDIMLRILFSAMFGVMVIEGGGNIYDRIKDLMKGKQELADNSERD